MKILSVLLVFPGLALLPATTLAGPAQHAVATDFDEDAAGSIAAGLTGHAGDWRVVVDDSAPSGEKALAQWAKNPVVSRYSIVRMCSQAGDAAGKGRPSQDASDAETRATQFIGALDSLKADSLRSSGLEV